MERYRLIPREVRALKCRVLLPRIQHGVTLTEEVKLALKQGTLKPDYDSKGIYVNNQFAGPEDMIVMESSLTGNKFKVMTDAQFHLQYEIRSG